jgi:hypothetical protein
MKYIQSVVSVSIYAFTDVDCRLWKCSVAIALAQAGAAELTFRC